MAQLERKASLQRVNGAKAYLLARSGIEDAMARLDRGQDPNDPGNRYAGEDWDASGTLNGLEVGANEVYRPGILDTDACPLRHALRPSFFAADLSDPSRKPLLLSCDGRQRGYSGRLKGDAATDGNTYTLKVSSLGGFYVNGGDPMAATDVGYNAVLRRMLGTLADAIDQDELPGGALAPQDGIPVGRADGERLIDLRPNPGGWISFAQIRDIALGGSQAKLDALRPYLTLHAWVDKRVIRPNAVASMSGKDYPSWGQIQSDHGGPPSFEIIAGRIVGRAPVDFRWARHQRPALIALLSGLKGLYLDDSTYKNWSSGNVIGTLRAAEITNVWVSSDDCHVAADAILTSTSPLSTWQEFGDFCGSLPLPDTDPHWGDSFVDSYTSDIWTADLKQAKKDLLKANFNPNTDLNKFNPNRTLWKTVDKSDLLVGSTEFSLVPLNGYKVQGLGRVLGPDGRLLACRVLTVDVAGPSIVRLSTQKEFVCGDLGNLDVPGDEINPRRPGYSVGTTEAYISQSQGTGKTWGHTLNTRAPATLYPPADYASSWMNGDSYNCSGASLQSYPEPYYDRKMGQGLEINPADYDGNLQLATVETVTSDFYEAAGMDLVTGMAVLDMKMLARFDDGFDLDVAESTAANGSLCKPDVSQVTTTELDHSVWDAAKSSTLYPDGVYSDKDRAPSYRDQGNADGFHGVLSLWVKPNYRFPQVVGRMFSRIYVTRTNLVEPYLNPLSVSKSRNQMFGLADYFYSMDSVHGLELFFEIGHEPDDVGNEFKYYVQVKSGEGKSPRPHVWSLATASWDERHPNGAQAVPVQNGKTILNDGTNGQTGDYPGYSYMKCHWATAADLTLPDKDANGNLTDHLLTLGTLDYRDRLAVYDEAPQGSDTTFDELAIYDFGGASGGTDASPASLGASNTLALNRYREGRYYKEAGYRAPADPRPSNPSAGQGEAASWTSAPLSLPPGSVLRQIDWTWYRPAALPDDYAEIDLLKDTAADYLWTDHESRSRLGTGWSWDRQDWSVGKSLTAPFRLRVVFQRVTPVGGLDADGNPLVANTPILDSPVLDDLTILYTSSGGASILAWQTGGE